MKYNPETGQGKTYNLTATINVIIKSSDGIVWVGTNDGLFEYGPASDSFKRPDFSPVSDQIPSIIEDSVHQVLWILHNSEKSTLMKFDLKNRSSQTFSLNQEPVRRSDVWQSDHQSVGDRICQDNFEMSRLSFYGYGNGRDRKSMQAHIHFFVFLPPGSKNIFPPFENGPEQGYFLFEDFPFVC